MSAAAKALCMSSRNSLYDLKVGFSQEITFWTKASFHAFAIPFVIYERMKIIFLSSSLYILLFNAKYKWQSCKNELRCSRFPSNSVGLLILISFPFECGIVVITGTCYIPIFAKCSFVPCSDSTLIPSPILIIISSVLNPILSFTL